MEFNIVYPYTGYISDYEIKSWYRDDVWDSLPDDIELSDIDVYVAIDYLNDCGLTTIIV